MRDSRLSSVLVYYLVFATLLPALHLGFTDHCHSYDHSKKQYVDYVVLFQEGIDEEAPEQLFTNPSLTENNTHRSNVFRCAICNGLIQSSIQIDLNVWATNLLCETSNCAFYFGRESRPQEIITVAPKQSPPTQA